MVSKNIRSLTTKAKQVGKSINRYQSGLQMVPYANTAITAANYAVGAADAFADLMDLFTPAAPAGGPMTTFAGVSNSLLVKRSKPVFKNSKGTVRLVHKELVASVTASSTVLPSLRFNSGNSVYQVNGGCGTSFPWLSQVATNFDCYRFKKLRLVYVPQCATSQDGRVGLFYDVDSADSIPLDRQSLSSYSCSVEGSPWATMVLDCDLSDPSKWYLTDSTSSNTAAGASNALLDQGMFFSVSYGCSGSAVLGEVYALYDVELKDPQPGINNVYQSYGAGAVPVQLFPSNSPLFNAAGTSNSIVFNVASPGRYLIHLTGVFSAVGAPTVSTTGSLVNSNAIAGGQVIAIVSTDSSASVTFPGLTGLGNWTLYVSKTPYYSTTIF